MPNISYSVVIRTLGNAGAKYHTLIKSISEQSIPPEEIIVVIPDGYSLDHTFGNERIVRSQKGMVTQRAVGIQEAKSEYVLVLDDDLQFGKTFVADLFDYLLLNHLDCVLSFPLETDDEKTQEKRLSLKHIYNNHKNRLMSIRRAYTGQHIVTYKKENIWFDKVTLAAGHKTYESNPQGQCNCGCFQCFFSKTKIAQDVHFENDLWLEEGSISKYAAYDDMVYFYKMYLLGGQIAYSNKAKYVHLDAGAGRPAKSKLEAKRIRLYSISRNRSIFWYKYLLHNSCGIYEKSRTVASGLFFFSNYFIYNLIANINPKYWEAIFAMVKGYADAYRYCIKK